MRLTRLQYEEILSRNQTNPLRQPASFSPAEKEVGRGGLHQQIMDYCDTAWPRLLYIHARTDKRSTIGVGVSDFTIFLPGGRTLHLEAKAKNGKPTIDQLSWAAQLDRLNHVHRFCYSYGEFLQILKALA